MVTRQANCVTFRFYRPNAHRVHLVGDFNGWGHEPLLMTRTRDGYWVAALRLPPGDHQFQYRADGDAYLDFAANGLDFGPLGANSVVTIPPPSPEPAVTAPAPATTGRRVA
jgi:1,4-alpha-glucan branching enzyme